ncbi:hypothetical protein [Streptococcus thermophilus]|uniref:hypothetical protein n=1 Tax=Streptococcus thermophilus TaxID=1308 RepID=UPI00321FFA47
MEYTMKIEPLGQFKAWGKGLETLNTVRERGGLVKLTELCESFFGDSIPTDTDIYDWLWFDSDFIYKSLGYDDLLD